MNIEQRLIADWRWVLTHSWTVRLLLLSAALDGLALILPLYTDAIPKNAFALLSGVTTVAAIVARFALQQRTAGDNGAA